MSIRSARKACLPAALCLAGAVFSFGAHAQSATLVAAGSLNLALSEVAQNFNAATGITVTQTFGPSGTVRSEIEGGLKADVFASADTASPAALQQEGFAGPVQEFARNQIVAVFRSNFGRNATSRRTRLPGRRHGLSSTGEEAVLDRLFRPLAGQPQRAC